MSERTQPDQATVEADRAAAQAPHGASEVPTPEEEGAAEANAVSEATRQSYEEMTEKGANQQGEGRLP